jgi:putative dimethyl sulfoxide reductase chaperone
MTPPDSNPRARLYALLARLLLDEPDRPLARYLRGLPGLAEYIPRDAELDDWLADMRAEHQRLFGLNIYPYESIFRDRELMLNSAATQRFAALYEACGFAPAARLRAGAPDHLGVELALMAELATRAPRDPAARAHTSALLHGHLAAWLPACAEAIGRVARAPLHRALAEIAVELVLGELAEWDPPPPHPQPLSPAWERGSGGEGADNGLDLHQIVRSLLTPDEVGIFICRADMAAAGHALGLPAPVAERGQMLLGLFEAAGRFEMVPALLGELGDRLRAADATYARLAAAHPAWGPHGRAWRGRVANGLALLEGLARDLQRIEDRR